MTMRRRSKRSAAAPPRTPNSSIGQVLAQHRQRDEERIARLRGDQQRAGREHDAVADVVDERCGQEPAEAPSEPRWDDGLDRPGEQGSHRRQDTNRYVGRGGYLPRCACVRGLKDGLMARSYLALVVTGPSTTFPPRIFESGQSAADELCGGDAGVLRAARSPQYRSKKYWPLIAKSALSERPPAEPAPKADRSNSVRSLTGRLAGTWDRSASQ